MVRFRQRFVETCVFAFDVGGWRWWCVLHGRVIVRQAVGVVVAVVKCFITFWNALPFSASKRLTPTVGIEIGKRVGV